MSDHVEETLSEKDLFDIQEELHDARAKWRTIGLGLKLPPSDLEVIDRDKADCEEKFESVLLRWLKNGNECTWSTLYKVLSTRTVGKHVIAKQIKEKYIDKSTSVPETASPLQLPPRDAGETLEPGETAERNPTPERSTASLAQPLGTSSPETPPILADSGTVLMTSTLVARETERASAAENKETVHSLFQSSIQSAIPLSEGSSASQEALESSDIMPVKLTATYGQYAESSTTPSSKETSLAKLAVMTAASCSSPPASSQEYTTTGDSPGTPLPRVLTLKEGITLRSYQEELALPGLQGSNYILVAPTGTGKTLVSGQIIMHHLNKMLQQGRKGKVAFVTPTRQLTSQQKKKLQEYIPGIRAVDITGASGKSMHPLVQSSGVDVIVCTAGKLRRELKTKAIEITDFSLIVADECHHAGRHSNYSDIMEFLVRLKLTGKPVQLPQVVGMTASPGAGKGKTMATALDHQLFLCGTLNATAGITAVQQNIKELESVRNEPRSYLEVQDERSPNDPFVLHVKSAMKALEHFIGDIPCLEKGSSKYIGWLVSEKEAAENREEDERERISVLDQLKVYSLCLLTYRDFRHEDAMSVLEEIEEFQDQSSLECSLHDVHKGLMDKLSGLPKTPSPLLDHMESILLNQFARCPESKGIFFVQTIKHTKYATNWIKSSPALSRIIRVTPITGHYREGGMEKSEQQRVLEGFRRGTYNLLASTSVLEEGLDVTECNFVIRYQNVSNEIAQVQAKGRARAEDSRMYTVVSTNSNKEYWYLVQEEKHRMVEASVKALQGLHIAPLLVHKQKLFIEKRDQIAQQKQKLRCRWPVTEEVEVRCKKCNVLACKGSDVFAYNLSGEDPHYVVPSESFSSKYITEKHTKSSPMDDFIKPYRMFCHSRNCRNKWGVIALWSDTGYKFPLLKCESFLFKYGDSTRRFKKWKDIWFDIQTIQDWVEFEDDEVPNSDEPQSK